jgi:hypothetical protein
VTIAPIPLFDRSDHPFVPTCRAAERRAQALSRMPLAAPATAGATRPGQREHGATILRQGQRRSDSLRGYRPALCLDYWWEVRNQQYRKRRLTDRGGVFKYVLRLPAKGSYGTGSAISSRARRPAAERRATFPCKLRLAGGKLEQSASGDLRGRIGSRQALSARRLHRHQPVAPGRAARPGGEPW